MGVLILLFFGGIPIAIGAYLIWKIEKSLPVGELVPLHDDKGGRVLDKTGKPLYVDEEGKVFGYKATMSWYKRKQRHEWCKGFLIGWYILSLLDRRNR